MEITVEQWLAGKRDYQQGVRLYEKYGSNLVFLKVFKTVKNDYTIGKLADLLSELKGAPPVEQDDEPEQPVTSTQIQIKVIEDPEVIKITRDRAMNLYKECSHLHAQLPLLLTDAERLIAATKILDNMDEVERCWDFVDEYDETGIVPQWEEKEAEDFTKKDKADLIMDRNRHRTQRSKLKAKLQKGGTPDQMSRWGDDLVLCEKELEQINQLLEKPVEA